MRRALAIFVLALSFAAPAVARAQDVPATEEDPSVVKLREKFREGFEKYRAGQYGEAILVWNPIYKELGPAKGYRLSFNLARAFDQIHDELRAADHYEAYLDEVEARLNTGETLEPMVLKQRDEANERIEELRKKLARLRFRGAQVLVTVDAGEVRLGRGTSYVAAGKHAVVWRPATPEEQRVELNAEAGAIVDLEAPPLPERPAAPPPPPPVRWESRQEHPFPKSLIYVGAGVTALSFIVPPILYANALATKDEYDAHPDVPTRDTYSSEKTTAYASWAIPALLGGATIALALYWYYGEKTVRVPVTGLGPGYRF
ncbi:MAG: hypothetical protein U0270_32480 [Labilithrix sp.]